LPSRVCTLMAGFAVLALGIYNFYRLLH
jgi:hypothetical protein